ncbi:hypothetical protein V8F20_004873 [Naviculisporaceae sp. PSN 640]
MLSSDSIITRAFFLAFEETLPDIIKRGYGKKTLWGVQLDEINPNHAPTKVILKKFLKSRGGNIELAGKRLSRALCDYDKYVVEFGRLNLHYPEKFRDLGFVTCHRPVDAGQHRVVVIWNLFYKLAGTEILNDDFDDIFFAWRVSMIELALTCLDLNSIEEVPRYNDPDPYIIRMVYDFIPSNHVQNPESVSFMTAKNSHQELKRRYPRVLGQVVARRLGNSANGLGDPVKGLGDPVKGLGDPVKGLKGMVNKQRTRWRRSRERRSIGKLLPKVRDAYPGGYSRWPSGFRVRRQTLQISQNPHSYLWDDDGFIKWSTNQGLRQENTPWWEEKLKILKAEGYFFEGNVLRLRKTEETWVTVPIDKAFFDGLMFGGLKMGSLRHWDDIGFGDEGIQDDDASFYIEDWGENPSLG